MNKFFIVFISIFLCSIIFFLGVLGGAVFWRGQGIELLISQSCFKNQNIVQGLDPAIITSIIAYGEISDINETSLRIGNDSKTTQIEIDDSTKIYHLVKKTEGDLSFTQEQIDTSDVKNGDKATITIKLAEGGTFIGETILIQSSKSSRE